VQVVERQVEIRVPLKPTRRDWPRLLDELAAQLSDGRVYDRDLPGLGRALQQVLRSYRWRARPRDRRPRDVLNQTCRFPPVLPH
jgi:hypothetical protein